MLRQCLPAALLLLLAAATQAAEPEVWPVEGKLFGPEEKRAKDVSGLACVEPEGFPRHCLAIDDEMTAAQFLTLEDGLLVAGPLLPLQEPLFEGEALSLDGEAVAHADGFFYVLGSHGHPRDPAGKLDPEEDAAEIAAKIAAASLVFRIADDEAAPAVAASKSLRALLAAEPALASAFDRRLQQGGLTLEGAAVVGGRLFAGLRAPLFPDGHAGVFSAALEGLFAEAPAEPRLQLLRLGEGQGIRDLAAYDGGFLLLGGPSGDEAGAFTIRWWDGGGAATRLLAILPPLTDRRGRALKAEGLLPLGPAEGGLAVLVLFDGEAEGGPRAWIVESPPAP